MLLIQKKRFQFNKSYIYGSAAFIVGFGAVMAVLVHNAPIKVSQAETGIGSGTLTSQPATDDAAKPAQTNEAPAEVALPTNNGAATGKPAASSTPTQTAPTAQAPTTPV